MADTALAPAITAQVRDGVGIVSFASPDRLNAVGPTTIPQLQTALEEMGHRHDVRVVILRGEGRAFCAGLDLAEGLADPNHPDATEAMASAMRAGADLIWTIRSIRQPVIAAVQGWAVGAGFAFAVAADIRFIGHEAKFSAPFLKLGMSVGDLGLSWFLPRLIGAGRATQVFFEAGIVDAEQAVTFGLASHISDDPMADAIACAERLAGFPPYGVETSKQLINASGSSSLRDHLDAEARAQVIGSLTESAKEAMAHSLARTKMKEH